LSMHDSPTAKGTDHKMSASSSAPTPPADIGSPEDWVTPRPKPKAVPSWKWSLARSNASPVILSEHEEFDWKSFSCRSSSSGIDALPLEVFEMIVNHLQLCDRKSLRLVNKAHLLRLTPQVFCHVTVHLHPTSFQGLHSIAAHSHLRHLVRSLTYDIRMVPEFKTSEVWQSVKERFIDPAYNPEGATFAEYEAYYAAQVLAAKADRQNLEHAFRDLPNLSSLELSTGPAVMGADWIYPKFTEFDLEKFGSLLPKLGTIPCALGSKKHQDRFLSLLLASQALGSRLTSLTLDKLEWTSERLLAKLSQRLDKERPLRNLKHLKLGLNVLVGRKIYQNYWMYSTARKPYCVTSVGDLDSLEFRFHYTERLSVWGPYEDAIVPYSELGRDHIWQTYIDTYWSTGPKIKRLALINIASTPTQLKMALEGSRGLEHIELENIRLTEGNWLDVFEAIARAWDLSITDIGLKGEFSSWSECWQADATAVNLDRPPAQIEAPEDLVHEPSANKTESAFPPGAHTINTTTVYISDNLYAKLLEFPEPERSSRWLKCCFEESPADRITQVALWKAYQNRFVGDSPIVAADFMKILSTTFRTAEAQVTNDPQPQFIIKGIRPRHVWVKSQPGEALLLRLRRWIVGRGLGVSPLATTNVVKYVGESPSMKTLWDQFGCDIGFVIACVTDSDDREAAGDSTFTFSPGKLPKSEDDSWRRG
jgi:hypothetical protein